ncbi:nitrophenyl compound nitroreductase subunit ArsF family protein [Fibrobacterota bacterium]
MKHFYTLASATLVAVSLLMTVSSCQEKNKPGSETADDKSLKSNTTVTRDEKTKPGPAIGSSVIKVRYFYSDSYRCASCRKIEAYTKDAVKAIFSNELQAGKMEFSLVDIDKEENKPAVEKYKLFTKSVIVSEFSGDQEIKWQNLDKVWTLLGDEVAFKAYIVNEIKSYL